MAYNEIAAMKARSKGATEAGAVKAGMKAPKGDGLVDMALPKRKKGDKNKNYDVCCAPSEGPDGPRYPYGLEVRLDDESFRKLGIDLPDAGTTMTLAAKVKVVESSSRSTQSDGEKQSCTLQITKMKLG